MSDLAENHILAADRAPGAPTIFKEEGDLMRFSGGLEVGLPKVVRFG